MNNNLYRKIATPPKIKTKNWFCFWSDLLGFGEVFLTNNWQLNTEQKTDVYKRLQAAHSIFIQHTLPNERAMILNDGLVKIYNCDNIDFAPGFFLRSCIYTHLGIKMQELSEGLPGPRSILSFGESIQYLADSFYLDDYVFDETKHDPGKLSTIARESGNPLIVYNPAPFQMNAAFSKSYLLDSIGSSQGVSGNFIYLDQSVIDFTVDHAKKAKRKLIYEEENGYLKVIVLPTKSYGRKNLPYWGFKLEKAIPITYKGWTSNIYRLAAFFPPDEDYTIFQIETI